jgi:hypothetical protein
MNTFEVKSSMGESFTVPSVRTLLLPRNGLESLSSSLSAFRFEAFPAEALRNIGGLPASTITSSP